MYGIESWRTARRIKRAAGMPTSSAKSAGLYQHRDLIAFDEDAM
jgi:hypothetical protein